MNDTVLIAKPAGIRPGMHGGTRVKWASAVTALFGIALVGASLMAGGQAMLSMLLSLAGISIFLISILFYFVTPQRMVREDVRDAEIVSSTGLISALLAPIAGDEKGVYIPSSRMGTTWLFIPINRGDLGDAYGKRGDVMKVSVSGMDGLLITPPGSGLLTYVKSLGATFTDAGLEDEIKDVLVNGTELASRVEVYRDAGRVRVRLYGVVNSLTCRTIREEDRAACARAACPVCSFVACMVAEGTGKPVQVTDVKPDGKALEIIYRLM